jgi:hypothetical protein
MKFKKIKLKPVNFIIFEDSIWNVFPEIHIISLERNKFLYITDESKFNNTNII